MSTANTLAMLALAAGVLLLLAWAYVTTDNPRSNTLVAKSLWLFVLPLAATWLIPDSIILPMWAWILAEEALKAIAGTTERTPSDRFWLISLFGILELMLAKPLWWLATGDALSGWDRLQLSGLIAASAVAVLMHTVTAAIYAFHFERRLWAAFLVSCVVHAAYNGSVELFGVSPMVSGMQALILMALLMALLPDSFRRGLTAGSP